MLGYFVHFVLEMLNCLCELWEQYILYWFFMILELFAQIFNVDYNIFWFENLYRKMWLSFGHIETQHTTLKYEIETLLVRQSDLCWRLKEMKSPMRMEYGTNIQPYDFSCQRVIWTGYATPLADQNHQKWLYFIGTKCWIISRISIKVRWAIIPLFIITKATFFSYAKINRKYFLLRVDCDKNSYESK